MGDFPVAGRGVPFHDNGGGTAFPIATAGRGGGGGKALVFRDLRPGRRLAHGLQNGLANECNFFERDSLDLDKHDLDKHDLDKHDLGKHDLDNLGGVLRPHRHH